MGEVFHIMYLFSHLKPQPHTHLLTLFERLLCLPQFIPLCLELGAGGKAPSPAG